MSRDYFPWHLLELRYAQTRKNIESVNSESLSSVGNQSKTKYQYLRKIAHALLMKCLTLNNN